MVVRTADGKEFRARRVILETLRDVGFSWAQTSAVLNVFEQRVADADPALYARCANPRKNLGEIQKHLFDTLPPEWLSDEDEGAYD